MSIADERMGVTHLLEHPDHTLLRESFLDEPKNKGYDVEVTIFYADSVTYPATYPQRASEEAKRMETLGLRIPYM